MNFTTTTSDDCQPPILTVLAADVSDHSTFDVNKFQAQYKAQLLADREEKKKWASDHLKAMKLLPWFPGHENSQISRYTGLAYQDGVRYKLNYSGHHERLWCEANELCQHDCFNEARIKLDQMGGFDEKLEAVVACGLASKKQQGGGDGKSCAKDPAQMTQLFKNAAQMLTIELLRDNNSEDWEVLQRLHTLVTNREKEFVPQKKEETQEPRIGDDGEILETYPSWFLSDYDSASSAALEEAADAWMTIYNCFHEMVNGVCDGDEDAFNDAMIGSILPTLFKRTDDPRAREAAKNISYKYMDMVGTWSTYDSSIFIAVAAELAESFGERSTALKAYNKLRSNNQMYKGYNEDGQHIITSMFEVPVLNQASKNEVPQGSLAQRIQRNS